jgi:hypothetical protein
MRAIAVTTALLAFTLAGGPVLAASAGEFVKTKHDAGEVEKGSTFEVHFPLRNTGDEPIQITGVEAQCGCTVTDYDPVIGPGETGDVSARVETETLAAGKNAKTITVMTDAAGLERTVLTIRMNVVAPLELLPRPMLYLRSAPGEERIDRVLARPHRPNMKITGIKSSNAAVSATLEPAEPAATAGDDRVLSALLPQEGDAWIVVRLAPSTPEGIHRADVTITTSDPDYPEAVLKVNAVVRP